jgi:sugar O-acyltransferase (sialic acid O-acetyltransferase NeuD family)
MSKPNLILIGAGGHARACIDVVEQEGTYKVAGLVGLPDEVGNNLFGYEVIATDADLEALAKQYENALIALGQIHTADSRIQLYRQAQHAGFRLKSVISRFAYVSPHAEIGEGTIVMNGAIVNAGSQIGVNCIINSNSLIEHDVLIEDHCHVSTGSIVNGNSTIGSGVFIGSGVVVKQGVSIGTNSIIGMGLTVREDIANDVSYLGARKS